MNGVPKLGNTLYFFFTTHNPSTGAVANADSLPTCDVYEDDTAAAILSPTVVNVATGRYRVPVAATVGNGFEAEKSYNAVAAATVNSITANAVVGQFTLAAADTDDIAPAVALGAVASVTGDVAGKVLGGGSSTISGTGARVVDASGNNVATAANQTTILDRIGAWTGTARNTILGAFQALIRSDADATMPSDINADLGSGAGDANNTTDSAEALRDRGDTAWTTATGFSTLDAQDVADALKLAPTAGDPAAGSVNSDLDTVVGKLPTGTIAQAGDAMTLSDGAITAAKIASGALTAAKFVAAYYPDFDAVVDEANNTDRYTATIYDARDLSIVTPASVTIRVDADGGANLFTAQAMTRDADTGAYYYTSTTQMAAGVSYTATIVATISAVAYTFALHVGRDSA